MDGRDILTCDLAKTRTAGGIQRKVHHRIIILTKSRPRIIKHVPADQNTFADKIRRTFFIHRREHSEPGGTRPDA